MGRCTKLEFEKKVLRAADIIWDNAGERGYRQTKRLMEAFGCSRRTADKIAKKARERLAANRGEAFGDLMNSVPEKVARLWATADAKGDRRTQAKILDSLLRHVPQQQDVGVGSGEPDEVTFEIVQQGDQEQDRAVPADDNR